MSILGAWTSLSDFNAFASTVAMTTPSKLAPYVKEGIQVVSQSGPAQIIFPTGISDGWISFNFYGESSAFNTSSTSGNIFAIRSSRTGPILFQLDFDTYADLALESWNGSVFTEQSNYTTGIAVEVIHKMDIHVKLDDVDGVIDVYLDNNLILNMSGDTILAGFTAFDTIEFCRAANESLGNGQITYSAVILADEDTRAMVFNQGQSTGAGVTTGWTSGDYTDVTKLGRDDNTFIKSETADQTISFTMDDVNSALNAYTPRAVILSTCARKGVTGPQNMQGVVRQLGTDFTTANVSGLNSGYEVRQIVMNTNPATSSTWSISEINANEFGLKSIA